MIKVAALLMMVSACLTYPSDELRPPPVNAEPENVPISLPSQPSAVAYERIDQAQVPGGPILGQGPIPEQGTPLAKTEDDLKTDSSYWWRRSYYPHRRSYYYHPRSYSYYKSYPYYSYWNPYSYWW